MSFKHFVITTLFTTNLMASASAPTSKQLTEEELRDTLMPDVVRYFDITAYGGERGEVALPEDGVYTKTSLLAQEEFSCSFGGNPTTAIPGERKAWAKAIESSFTEEEISAAELLSFINALDINGDNEDLCEPTSKGGYVPGQIWYDRRGAINPFAYKYTQFTELYVTHHCTIYPNSLMWLSSLTKVDLNDTGVDEIPAFVYSLPHLKTLSVTSSLNKPTAFHDGMKALTHIKLKMWDPTKDILTLPALQELGSWGNYLPQESEDVVRELRKRGVTGMRYRLPRE